MKEPSALPDNPPASGRPPRPRSAWEFSLLVFLAAATLWVACFCFPIVWVVTGIGEPDKPFLDLRNLISAADTARLGLDPHVSNPLDPYHRLHGFSDWWLLLGRLGITGADLPRVGAGLLAAVLITTVLVCRPATGRAARDLVLALAAPPLLMAAHRANPDLVAFVLMGLSLICLRRDRRAPRALAIVLLALAAALKYFPLAAIILLLEARTRRELLGWFAIYASVLLLAWPSLQRSLGIAAAHMPAPSWLYAFGAPMIFRNLDLSAATVLGWTVAGLLLGAGALLWWPRAPRPADQPSPSSPEFLAGAIMVVGCFLHGSSYAYKLIFALWLLPGLWRPAESGTDMRWRDATKLLLFTTLWFEGAAVTVFNVTVMNFPVPVATGDLVLRGIMLLSQLLAWALCLLLWRSVVIYLNQQWQRWIARA